MANGDEQYVPGSIFQKAMQDPALYQKAKASDDAFGTDLTKIFEDMNLQREKLNFLTSKRASDIDNLPSVYEQKPNPIDSELLGGNSLTGPNPAKNVENLSNEGYIDSLLDKFKNVGPVSQNALKWAQPYNFNTGPNNATFDRYYTHRLYKDLGFNPYRDNERLYNSKATWLDDFRRMSGQFGGLFMNGVKGVWGADISEDQERRLAIAQTSKEGAGAFTTNLVAQLGFSAGLLSDVIVEELALGAVTAATGGLASEVTLPLMGAKIARATALLSRAKGFKRTKELLESMRGVDGARTFYAASKSGKMALGAADFFNPFQYSTRAIYGIAKGAKGYKGLEGMALASTTFGGFYKDYIRLRAAYSETKLEGELVQMGLLKDEIGDHYTKYGKNPEGEDAERLYSNAKEANFKTQLMNMPLILYSNDIVFGKAFRGFKPKWLAKAEAAQKIPSDIARIKGWKAAGTKAAELLPSGAKKFTDIRFWKQAPSKIALGTIQYGKANFTEAIQENLQEAVSAGMEDYYKKIYHDPFLAGSRQGWASFRKGTASQISGQGLETFLSGFLMGGMLQTIQAPVAYAQKKFFTDHKAYEADRLKQGQELTDAYNAVIMETGKMATFTEQNAMVQKNLAKDMLEAETLNDRKFYHDAKNASMYTHITTLLQHDQYDVWTDALKDMNQLTDQELKEALGGIDSVEGKDIRTRLADIIEEAENIKKIYDNFGEKFEDPSDPTRFNRKTNPEGWLKEKFRKDAYEKTRIHASFGYYSFHKALSRMSSVLDAAGGENAPLAKAPALSITVMFDRKDRLDRIKTLNDEYEIYKDGDATQKKLATKTRQELDAAIDLSEALSEYEDLVIDARDPNYGPSTKQSLRASKIAQTLKDKYFKYVKVLARHNNENALDEKIYPSLNGMMDFIELQQDAKSLSQYINFMHDPENFATTAERELEANQRNHAAREEVMTVALTAFQKMADGNDSFNDLFDIGVFIVPETESMKAFTEGRDDEIVFTAAVSPYGPILPDSDKHKEAMEIIKKYREKHPISPIDTALSVEGLAEKLFSDPNVELTPEEKEFKKVNQTEIDIVLITLKGLSKKAKVDDSAPIQTKDNTKITSNTPIEEINKLPDLLVQLKEGYKEFQDKDPTDKRNFEEYVSGSSLANIIIQVYNAQEGRIFDPKATKKVPLPPLISAIQTHRDKGLRVVFGPITIKPKAPDYLHFDSWVNDDLITIYGINKKSDESIDAYIARMPAELKDFFEKKWKEVLEEDKDILVSNPYILQKFKDNFDAVYDSDKKFIDNELKGKTTSDIEKRKDKSYVSIKDSEFKMAGEDEEFANAEIIYYLPDGTEEVIYTQGEISNPAVIDELRRLVDRRYADEMRNYRPQEPIVTETQQKPKEDPEDTTDLLAEAQLVDSDEALQKIENKVKEILIDPERGYGYFSGIGAGYYGNLMDVIQAKGRELAGKITITGIKVGQKFAMKDTKIFGTMGRAEVIDVSPESVTVAKIGDFTKTDTYTRKEFVNAVWEKIDEEFGTRPPAAAAPVEPMTPKEKEITEENIKNQRKAESDPSAINKEIDENKDKSPDDAWDDFDNNIDKDCD